MVQLLAYYCGNWFRPDDVSITPCLPMIVFFHALLVWTTQFRPRPCEQLPRPPPWETGDADGGDGGKITIEGSRAGTVDEHVAIQARPWPSAIPGSTRSGSGASGTGGPAEGAFNASAARWPRGSHDPHTGVALAFAYGRDFRRESPDEAARRRGLKTPRGAAAATARAGAAAKATGIDARGSLVGPLASIPDVAAALTKEKTLPWGQGSVARTTLAEANTEAKRQNEGRRHSADLGVDSTGLGRGSPPVSLPNDMWASASASAFAREGDGRFCEGGGQQPLPPTSSGIPGEYARVRMVGAQEGAGVSGDSAGAGIGVGVGIGGNPRQSAWQAFGAATGAVSPGWGQMAPPAEQPGNRRGLVSRGDGAGKWSGGLIDQVPAPGLLLAPQEPTLEQQQQKQPQQLYAHPTLFPPHVSGVLPTASGGGLGGGGGRDGHGKYVGVSSRLPPGAENVHVPYASYSAASSILPPPTGVKGGVTRRGGVGVGGSLGESVGVFGAGVGCEEIVSATGEMGNEGLGSAGKWGSAAVGRGEYRR